MAKKNIPDKTATDNRRGHNEGSIRERSDGTWEARYVTGRGPDGKLIRKSIYGKKRSEVAKKLTKALNELNQSIYVEPSKLPLGDWADTWLEKYKKINIKATTYNSYEQHIRVHIKPKLGYIKIKDLTTPMIQDFYIERENNGRQPLIKTKKSGIEVVEYVNKGLSAATIRKIHNILHEMMKKAVEMRLIPFNPCEAAEPPKIEKKMKKALAPEEITAFLKALKDEPLGVIFRTSLITGARRGELRGLTWKNVDLDEGFIYIDEGLVRIRDPKATDKKSRLDIQSVKTSNSLREIAIPDDLVDELKKIKTEQEVAREKLGGIFNERNLVFCTSNGTPHEPRNLLRTIYRICNKAAIARKDVHSLRHTAASTFLEIGVDLITLQNIMGHVDLRTTMGYTKIFRDKKKDVAKKMGARLKGEENIPNNTTSNTPNNQP